MTYHPKYPTTPPELIALVRDVVERRGSAAPRFLGLSKPTIAAILAGLPVMSGTIAILRLAQQRRDEAARPCRTSSGERPSGPPAQDEAVP